MEIIRFDHVYKVYQVGETCVNALDDISFTINEGEFVVVLGSSGAGKSTLLNILGGIDNPTSGNVFVNNKNIAKLKAKELSIYRRKDIGFIFQFYNLIPSLNALENVMLAASIAENPRNSEEVMKNVGLADRINNFPANLSGGEQQRVAIARAIVKNPLLLLCDEPTGALDSKTGVTILKLLKAISSNENKTVVVVTHNTLFAAIADHVLKIQDGKILENYYNDNPLEVDEIKW